MATSTDKYHPRDVTSVSTMTSALDVKHSNAESQTSIEYTDTRSILKKDVARVNKREHPRATIKVRVMEAYPKRLQAAASGAASGNIFYDNKRIEKMLSEPTATKNPSVTSDTETEFDWKDYNFKNGPLMIDPGLLDSNSDMAASGQENWERPSYYASVRENRKQNILTGPQRDIYLYYPRDNPSQSSSSSQISSGQIIRPEQIRGILKAKEASALADIEHNNKRKTVTYNESETLDTKDPYDISESIEAYNQYLKRRAVRFETDKSKKTKLRFLSKHLTVEKRAQWDRSTNRHRKGPEKTSYKLPPLKSTSIGYRTIQAFEKRNVNRTATKMGDVENVFLKSIQCPSECCTTSEDDDEEDDDDNEDDEGVEDIPRKRSSVNSTKMATKRQRVKRAMSLKGDEIITLPKRGGNQFKRVVNKVQKMINKTKLKDLQIEMKAAKRERKKTPLERFRHAGRIVTVLLRAVGLKPEKSEQSDYNFLSWTIMYDELGISRLSYDSNSLTFDPQQYKANKELSFLSAETRDILLTPPISRTDSQIQAVIRFLSQVVPAFGEYPLRIQRSTLKCCTYERFESGRVIIRQGHRAENFYFILSGTAVVTIMDSGVNHVHTVNILSAGNSFGELAFLNMSQRTATVTCRENVELLCIERDDFVEIFMRRVKNKEPEHVTFLRGVDVFKGWPIEKLPVDNLKICAFTYVRLKKEGREKVKSKGEKTISKKEIKKKRNGCHDL